VSSTALAAPRCNLFTVTGSYVRQVNPYIDQLKLGIDGTAYWFQSSSFDLILTGTYIPQIGSWTCLNDGTVLVTTIGTNFSQNSPFGDIPQPGQPLDINIFQNVRFTQKLSLVDGNTLQPTHRINTDIPLSSDPLGPGVASGCNPSGTPCNPAPYKRIRPQLTDIP
jgi:hypothetical protein